MIYRVNGHWALIGCGIQLETMEFQLTAIVRKGIKVVLKGVGKLKLSSLNE